MDRAEQAKAYIAQMMRVAEELTHELGLPSEDKYNVLRMLYTADSLPTEASVEEDEEERMLSYCLLDMEERLRKSIIAQEEAIEQVSLTLYHCLSGLKDPKNRLASFLFLGPRGVGKTWLAEMLAKLLPGKRTLITSYINTDDEKFPDWHNGLPLETVAFHPYSVILLEEIENAHPKFFSRLLQILKDGKLTQAKGHVLAKDRTTIDFGNTILIMTSNIGADLFTKEAGIRFRQSKANANTLQFEYELKFEVVKSKVLDELKKFFNQEFLKNIDDIVFLNSLYREDVFSILELLLKSVQEKAAKHQVELIMPQATKEYLIEKYFDPSLGAHSLHQTLEQLVEDPLMVRIIGGKFYPGDQIEAAVIGGELVLKALNWVY